MTDTTKMLTINADELADTGVSVIEFIEGVPDSPPEGAERVSGEAEAARIAELEAYIQTATKAIQSRDEAMAEIVELEARLKEAEGKAERWERAFRVRCIQADERDSEISDQFTLLANAEREARTRAEKAEARAESAEKLHAEAGNRLLSLTELYDGEVEQRLAAEADAGRLRAALRLYADQSAWVQYEIITETFCERTHAIKEEPRETYSKRYPKAVGVWKIKTAAGNRLMALCQRCAHRYMREGWIPK